MYLSNQTNRFYGEADRERRYPDVSRSRLEIRDDYERDHGRIIHSASFRRLQSKKQVIGVDVGDLHRTRLTHSMEAAQIARGMAHSLNQRTEALRQNGCRIDISLIEAAALAHDLGHPPFGHDGEMALHACMHNHGGFEGNAQTFRILSRLEGRQGRGLNLTRGLLLSVMKYPVVLEEAIVDPTVSGKHPPKASVFGVDRDIFTWVLAPFSVKERAFYLEREPDPVHPGVERCRRLTLECSIIELADDVAYATHDLEDAINLGWVHLDELREVLRQNGEAGKWEEWDDAVKMLDRLHPRHPDFKHDLKQLFAFLISGFVNHLTISEEGDSAFSPRIRYRARLPESLQQLNQRLKLMVDERVIRSPSVQAMSFKGRRIVRSLFEAITDEIQLLPFNDRYRIEEEPQEKERIVCDYIAGMTDPFAIRMAEKLYGSGYTL
ncbi:anti-phage deoxyguanosine triphosphatase [Desmospora activa]|uniref:Deoxyguanosinetriphosphate triphosphohydrolase-like protein n=1 Tax=Desmospora activa DSM 45169 TaxID=1121389 RepID=A0A2T4Z984_9BACL|nr:anti-phage deoxyguanosine triphosphatase [Desmospora activa]PTM58449.1 dGTPase [Desmospora activa DSM 45169]